MVGRFDTGTLIRTLCLLLVAIMGVWEAGASIEDAQKQLASYRANQSEMQDALAKQDQAAYESLGQKSLELLRDARRSFESSGAAESNDPAVVFSYAEVIRLAGDDDLGAEMVRAALDRGIESPALWRIYGEMCLAIGPSQYQKGVDALRKSTSMDGASPEAADAWFALGEHYLNREMPEAASKAFASALTANPAHVLSQLGDAAVKIYQGDIGGAGSVIEKVGRAAQPFDVPLRKMVRGALVDFDRSRRTFADTAENHYAYSRLLYIAARFPESVMACKRAGHLAPDRIEIWNFLAAVQMQLGDLPGAIDAFEHSLQAKADQPQVQQTLDQLRQAVQDAAKQAAPVGSGQGPLR